ncbi:MAG: hypothetical protein AAFZ07_01070 [Actinomycetota bacterium]
MARAPRTGDEASRARRPEADEADGAALRARAEPIEVEDPNQIGEGAIGRPDGRAAPSGEDLSSKTEFEGLPDPTARAGDDADGGIDPNDLDLAAGRDGRFPGDADVGEDPFGLDVDADALAAETHGGVPDLPGAGSSVADPFDDGLSTDVPDEYSLAGNEAGDLTGAADLTATIGGLAMSSNPIAQVGFGAYGVTRGVDEAFGISDSYWEQVDNPTGEFGDGEPATEEPEDDSGVDPGSSQLGDDKPEDHGETQDPNGQSEGEPATEPDQSEGEPDTGTDGQSEGEPDTGSEGMSVGDPATEPDQSVEPDPSGTTEDRGADSQTFGKSPSMDPEIGETYFAIQQGARGTAEVQYSDVPQDSGGGPIDYDGVDYGEGGAPQPVENIPADAIEGHDSGVIDPHDDPVNSFLGVDDSADASMEGAEPTGDAAETMEG